MDSYHSQYPLEYYEIGTPYMFYFSKDGRNFNAATTDSIKKYASVLSKTEKQKGEGYYFADRVIGVVIGKNVESKMIEVLFKGVSKEKNAYITVKYITNYTGVFCDDKEQYTASGLVDLSKEVNLQFAEGKSGGIALDKGKSGGIALDTGNRGGGIALD